MKSFIIFSLLACASILQGADFITGQAARAVVGQYSFSQALGYDGGVPSPTNQILGAASGIAWANGTLYVADDNRVGSLPNNNRIMMFNTTQIPGLHDDVSSNASFDYLCNLCGYPAYNVLGQRDFMSSTGGITQAAMNNPTAVATDGTILAVADTDNNRVLIWKSIPTQVNQNADIVLGQTGFTARQTPNTITASNLLGPQGVWIQNGKLFVADTQHYRVLIWNSIPTANNQPANVVLGQANFTSAYAPPVTSANPKATASELLNPVSVTSDGSNLYVADLGFNRVLIWNGIPTSNAQPANVVIGQPDMVSTAANNTAMCPGGYGNAGCNATINYPRFALSTGTRLFVADGGNDRILVFNTIPTANGTAADLVLGQPDFENDIVSNQGASIVSTVIDNTASVDSIPSPMSLAWDGTNLYASDPTNRRVLLYTPGDTLLQQKAVLNTASKITRQEGFVTITGTVVAADTVSISIGGTDYTYTVKTADTLETITSGLVSVINTSNSNAGDPNAIALVSTTIADTVFLDSRSTSADLNTISLSATESNSTDITTTASGSYLTGGNAGTAAPGTLIEIDDTAVAAGGMGHLADQTENANSTPSVTAALPVNLGGVQVYMDGIQLPLITVSPTQIIAQVPFTFTDRTSSSLYVRTLHNDGTMTSTTASPVTIAPANPGLFALSPGDEPRMAFNAMHQAGNPTATVSIDGSIQAGDQANITIAGVPYNYTVLSTDTLVTVAQALAKVINSTPDPNVKAAVGGAFSRVVLTSIQPGAAGSGIAVTGTQTAATGKSSASIVVTAYQSATCCQTTGSGPVTILNPAQANETITFLATGLGIIQDVNGNILTSTLTGLPYEGTTPNSAVNTVSATVAGSTAQVVSAGLSAGSIGVYQVQLIMPAGLAANNLTPVYIAQNAFISNTVTIPVFSSSGALVATPNPIPVPVGSLFGTATLSWSVAQSNIQLAVGAPNGPVVAQGGSTGGVTTGNWVTDGMTFYLQDATAANPTAASSTIATLTVHLQVTAAANATIFTANPNPVLVPTGTTTAKVTLGWYAPGSTQQEVHVGSSTGPIVSIGVGNTGTATTGNWVTDGMTFYLQDATNGNSTAGSNTLSILIVNVTQNSSVTTTRAGGSGGIDPITPSLSAVPNPVAIGANGLGQTTIEWTAPGATSTEIHVGSPSGPLFTEGGSIGSATTGEWITSGTLFYLQDASKGNSTSSAHTLASVNVSTLRGEATISASPNPITGTGGYGQTMLTWDCPYCSTTQIHVGSPSGPLFADSGSSGSQATGLWVTDGMTFYLQDSTVGDPGSSSNTVGTLVIKLK